MLASLHAYEAVKSIDRMVDVFLADEKDMERAMLSQSLDAVVSKCCVNEGKGLGGSLPTRSCWPPRRCAI